MDEVFLLLPCELHCGLNQPVVENKEWQRWILRPTALTTMTLSAMVDGSGENCSTD
jgi:hypothetical protein